MAGYNDIPINATAAQLETAARTVKTDGQGNKLLYDDGTYKDALVKPGAGGDAVLIGSGEEASGDNSVAVGGYLSSATGENAVAIGGTGNFASGDDSAVVGKNNTASGVRSFAGGYSSTASGANSLAFGVGISASGAAQVAVGSFNAEDADAVFLVGNGADAESKSNALAVKRDGSVVLGKQPAADNDAVTKQYVDGIASDAETVINNLRSFVDNNYATKTYVNDKVVSVYKARGTVNNYSDLPSEKEIGDVYNIRNADAEHGIKAGENVVWNGAAWDALGGTVDLSGYATETYVQNAIQQTVMNMPYVDVTFTLANDQQVTYRFAGQAVTE